MTRSERLRAALEEDFSGYDFAEWRSAEGFPKDPPRFAMIDACCTYAWVQFADAVEAFDDYFSEGFEPVAVVDLDTGERYEPVLRWRKAGRAGEPVHAVDCDLDEDCTCGAGDAETAGKPG